MSAGLGTPPICIAPTDVSTGGAPISSSERSLVSGPNISTMMACNSNMQTNTPDTPTRPKAPNTETMTNGTTELVRRPALPTMAVPRSRNVVGNISGT